ncbi:MAG: DUF1974 domain-containing protein, partial [Gammaproteobacteria bacterium]|nr:DUF1974 domain-containing protein [Gammaproteobacteria bacterium]
AIDNGIKPSIASSIIKCHITEFGRQVALDAMDIHGGKGICLGPNNYLGRSYQAAPIAITVEGANILTRNMMIFGQGAIRCHPYALEEMHAVTNNDTEHFDNLIYRHAGYMASNFVRSFWLSLTMSRFSSSPKSDATKKYYQWINKFSANLAFAADLTMAVMGGELKRKESISARLGDVLSNLYMMSTVLKYYNDQGSPAEDLVIVDWSCKFLAYRIQVALNELCHNFPNKLISFIIRVVTLPLGNRHKIPSDTLNKDLTKLVSQPSGTRNRIMQYIFKSDQECNMATKLEQVLANTIAAEPIAKRLHKSIKENKILSITYETQIEEAVRKSIITESEGELLLTNHKEILSVINVDQFSPEELVSLSTRSAENTGKHSKNTEKNNITNIFS